MTGETLLKGSGSKFFTRLFAHRGALFGAMLTMLVVAVSLIGPYFVTSSPTDVDFFNRLQGPSSSHWFGTDQLGRDLFARIILGGRISLMIGVFVVIVAGVVGVVVGVLAAYYGGVVDMFAMRSIDILMTFPLLLLALVIITILGPGLSSTMLAVALASIPRFARITRGSALSIAAADYVEATRALGQRDWTLIFRHILPNCMAPIVVQATLLVAQSILISASLGFLGLGAQPPTPEWGAMIGDGRTYLRSAPHVFLFPSAAILITVLGFNLLGDGLRDAWDRRL